MTGEVSERRVQDAPQALDPGLRPVWTPDSSTLMVDLCRIDQADTDGFFCAGINLQRALGRLTPKQQAVLVLRFYDDLTEVQNAELLGVGLWTVKSQTRHALRRLRELARELDEPEPSRRFAWSNARSIIGLR